MKLPMREKYVDEALGGPWHVFGVHQDGTVDVADASRDVFSGLPPEVAEMVVKVQEGFRRKLYALLCGELPASGEAWVHRRSGTEYTVIEVLLREEDCCPAVNYRLSSRKNLGWCRPLEDFQKKFDRKS